MQDEIGGGGGPKRPGLITVMSVWRGEFGKKWWGGTIELLSVDVLLSRIACNNNNY